MERHFYLKGQAVVIEFDYSVYLEDNFLQINAVSLSLPEQQVTVFLPLSFQVKSAVWENLSATQKLDSFPECK